MPAFFRRARWNLLSSVSYNSSNLEYRCSTLSGLTTPETWWTYPFAVPPTLWCPLVRLTAMYWGNSGSGRVIQQSDAEPIWFQMEDVNWTYLAVVLRIIIETFKSCCKCNVYFRVFTVFFRDKCIRIKDVIPAEGRSVLCAVIYL